MIPLLAALALAAGAADPALATALPPPLPSPSWSPRAPAVSALSGGVPVWVLPARDSAIFELALVLRVGEQHDPQGVEGLCQVAFDLADEGAGELGASAFDAAARALGVDITSSCSGDTATVRLRGLRRNLEPALDLWTTVITEPGFGEPDLSLVLQRHIDRLKLRLKEPAGLADRLQIAAQYPSETLGRSPTEASLRAVTGEQVRAFWAERVRPEVAAIIAGGDLEQAQLLPLLEARLGGWKAQAAAPLEQPSPKAAPRESLVMADLPGAPQSAIRAFVPLPGPRDPSRAALDVAAEALGGSFTSRVNRNLREDKGWTYGARCRPVYRDDHGFLECATLVRADATAQAVSELRRELREAVGERPLSAEELSVHREGMLRSWLTEHETTSAQLGEALTAWRRALPADWPARYLAAIGQVDREAASRALAAQLALEKVSWVVVGDLAAIREPLEALGIPTEEASGP